MGRFARILAEAQTLTAPLIPPACPLCREPVSERHTLCPSCWKEVAFLNPGGCRTCGMPALGSEGDPDPCCDGCQKMRPPWERGRAVFRYEGGGRRLVLSLKHGDRVDILPLLGRWMARTGAALLADSDVVAPVPLHWQRRLKRKHNQAAGLALAACKAADRVEAFAPTALIRTRATLSQGRRTRNARTENVAEAFRPGSARLDGARVLLVDDVLTTGATLAECARTCLDAGARAVDVLVLALVVQEDTLYIPPPNEDEDDEAS